MSRLFACSLPIVLLFHGLPVQAADPTVRAQGRGAPFLFLQDGRKVTTTYPVSFPAQARPLALASADFDEDGMPDLASGYAAPDGTGLVTVHRGNVAALWPYGDAIRHGEPPAFLPGARVFTLPSAPDFLGAGDFDADGHWDLVAATLGSNTLYLLRGDGHGAFSPPEPIDLPGALTAFTAGEINRVDGLTDIAIGVSGPEGPQVLVFQSPHGALRGDPEAFPMAAPVTALAMLPLDDGHFTGLAVGIGNQLLGIHGRDRKLSYPKNVRDAVPPAEITRQTLPFAVRALAAGRFTSATLLDLAALGDDGKLHFLQRPDAAYQAARAELPQSLPSRNGIAASIHRRSRNSPALPLKPRTTELQLSGEVVLPSSVASAARLVTAHASLTGVDDAIVTDSGARRLHVVSRTARGASTMRLAASLDTPSGAPAAVLPLRLSPSALHGLVVLHAGQPEPSVIQPQTTNTFMVTNTQDNAPTGGELTSTAIPGSLRTAISNAYNAGGPATITFAIPTSDPNYHAATGTFTISPLPNTNCGGSSGITCAALPPLPAGCTLDGYTQSGASPNSLTGGDNAVLKIVISGASAGPGPVGIWLTNGSNTVRGLIVTGFNTDTSSGMPVGGSGIAIESSGNIVEGNFVGMDSTGAVAAPNYGGVASDVGPNVVGGTVPAARNLLSGNNYASFATVDQPPPNSDFFQGNFVGADRTGTKNVGGGGVAQAGIALIIGGTTAGAGNLISGDQYVGVTLNQGQGNTITPDDNLVQGNLIGTDVTGTASIPNGGGATIESGTGNQLGGSTPAARNVISGNLGAAVELTGIIADTTVQGNYIGVDISGAKALLNQGDGITVPDFNGTSDVTGALIGGENAGNVISANAGFGIELGGPTGGTVIGNLIGTDATGTKALGNGISGIEIDDGGTGFVIGGADTSAANIVAFNGGNGVTIDPVSGNATGGTPGSNSVIGNRIFSNTGAGVDVLSGARNLISGNAISSNGALGINVSGASASNACQANTAGANHLQNAPVLTPASGAQTLVSATATDPNNNTSEFSNCAAMANSGTVLNIAGSLNSLPNTTYTIEFFSNAACDSSGFGQGQTFLNRIQVTTGSNCIANIGESVNVANADLSLAMTYNSSLTSPYRSPGDTFIYQMVATNLGAASAAGVSLNDTLPAGVTYTSAVASQGTCGANGSQFTCNLGTLPSGATAMVNLTVTVTGVGSITNSATVASSTPDPTSANNTASEGISSSYGFPTIDHFSPASGVAGTGALALTIYGGPFYQGVTTVTANGSNLNYTLTANQTCSFGPCQGMNVMIPVTLTASQGTIAITVTNPTPGGGSYPSNFTIYPNPGTVTQFQLTGVPSSAVAGTSYNLTVTALDNCGNVVPGYRGIVSLSDALEIETFDPASGYQFTAADNGVHTFTTSFFFSEPYPDVITVTDQGSPSVTGTLAVTSINPLLGPASQLSANTPGNTPIGFPFQPLIATVQDADGDPLPGVTVTFTAPATGAGGAFSNGQTTINVVTDVNGNAQAILTANQTAGTFQVNATAGSLTAQWLLTSVTNVPAHIALASPGGLGCVTPITGPIDTQKLGALCLLVTDAQNNPVVSGLAVTFAAPVSGASINLAATTATTGSEGPSYPGIALLAPIGVSNGVAGQYQVTATIGSLSLPITFTNTATAAAITQIFTTGGGQSAAVRTPFATALLAMPQDAKGECVAQVPVTFTAPASGPSAILSAQTVATDPVTCIAQVTATANGIVGGPYNVTATAGGASVTFALTNTIGMTTLMATGGTPQATLPGTAFPAPLQVSLLDLNGNPLACRITFLPPASGASATLSATSVVANSSGAAQVSATANSTAGTYQVMALFGSARAIFNLSNVTPAAIVTTGGTPQSTAPGSAFAAPLQAMVTDGGGNPIAGITVSFKAPTTGASATLSSASALTNSAGIASITATANSSTGTYLVTAMAPGLSASAGFTLTNSAFSPCDVTEDGQTNISDVQKMIGEALGTASAANDLNADHRVNVVDIQIAIDAALKLGCSAQ